MVWLSLGLACPITECVGGCGEGSGGYISWNESRLPRAKDEAHSFERPAVGLTVTDTCRTLHFQYTICSLLNYSVIHLTCLLINLNGSDIREKKQCKAESEAVTSTCSLVTPFTASFMPSQTFKGSHGWHSPLRAHCDLTTLWNVLNSVSMKERCLHMNNLHLHMKTQLVSS